MGKLSHFFLFKIWIWWSVRQEMKQRKGECKMLYEKEGTIQQDSILREDNSALHPFISQNTVKNVIVSLFQITRALFCFSSTIDENTDTVNLIEGLVL